MTSDILHDQWLTRANYALAERVRQGIRLAEALGLRQSGRASQELPVLVHQGHEGDPDVQHRAGQRGEPVLRLSQWAFQDGACAWACERAQSPGS